MTSPIILWLASLDKKDDALVLTKRFPFTLTEEKPLNGNYLVYEEHQLALHQADQPKNFYVDFLSDAFHYRKTKLSKKNELLVRALGKTTEPLNILDLSAGFGRDAFLLASLGHHLTLVEQHPVVAALLQDGIYRLQEKHPEYAMHLHFNESNAFLNTLLPADYPDLIYCDPMFPSKQKSALVKRPLQILQSLISNDTPEIDLEKARQIAKMRVIVKRPSLAAPYQEQTPDFFLKSAQIRFDVYLHQASHHPNKD